MTFLDQNPRAITSVNEFVSHAASGVIVGGAQYTDLRIF